MTVVEWVAIPREIVSFLDEHNGTVTALATIVVAIFTCVLARVTGRQAQLTRRLAESTEIAAKAGQDGAAALPLLERAYLFFAYRSGCLTNLSDRWRTIKQSGRDATPPARQSIVDFSLVNHGKTPAIVKARTFTLQYRADLDGPARLPVEPIDVGAIVISGGVREPKKTDEFFTTSLSQPLTSEEVQRLGNGLYVLLFVGRVIYDDVFGREHETRVCWRYDVETKALVEYGGSEFNCRS